MNSTIDRESLSQIHSSNSFTCDTSLDLRVSLVEKGSKVIKLNYCGLFEGVSENFGIVDLGILKL